jgi:hypothetical protein
MDPLYLETLATLETANGRKTIKGPKGEDSFNLYNIKDFSGKGYRAFDKAEGSNDAYRVYASKEEANSDLISLLSRKYPKALEATSPLEFAKALKAGGYATDPAYVEKFVNIANSLAGRSDRQDVKLAAPAPAPTPAPTGRSLDELYAAAAGPRPPKRMPMTATMKAIQDLAEVTPLTGPKDEYADWYKRSTDQERGATKAEFEADSQSLLDIARASWMNTLGGSLARQLSRPEYEPDGFVPTEEDLVGWNLEEQEALREATSRPEFDRIAFDLKDIKDQQREAAKSGLGWALAGGMIAGLPEGAAVGVGTALTLAKAGVGSLALANQGRRAAALASAGVENVGAGLAMTAAQDFLQPNVHMQDYVIGAVADSVLGVLPTAPRILRDSAAAAEQAAIRRVLDQAITSRVEDVQAARSELGQEATPEEVNARVAEIQAERLKRTLAAGTSNLGADRKLIPDEVNDELFGETPTEAAPIAAMEFPTISDNRASTETGLASYLLNMPYNGTGVLSESALGPKVSKTYATDEIGLATHWDPGTTNGRAHIAQFERDYGEDYADTLASAKPKALSVVRRGNMNDEQIALARWLHKTFLPDLRVVLMDLELTPQGKTADYSNTMGDAWHIGRDISVIRFRPTSERWQHTLVHEFGHIIFDRAVHTVRGTLADGFKSAHAAWLLKYTNSSPDLPPQGFSRATEAALMRGPAISEPVRKSLGAKGPEGFIPSLMDILSNVVNRATGELMKPSIGELKYGTQYIPNLQEFSAEQFTKYIEAALADVLDWKPVARELDPVRKFFANLYQQFATLFNRVKQAGLLAPDQRVTDFFEAVRKSAKASATKARRLEQGLDPVRDADEFDFEPPIEAPQGPSAMMSTPAAGRSDADIMRDYGLDILAADTPAQKAELKAMVHLYRKAEGYPMPDQARMSKLLQSAPMKWAAPTALTLMSSKNPVARMLAAELLESGGGAGGRQQTAAIAKWIHEREYMGNAINDFQSHYKLWRNANGGGLREDVFGGEKWTEFNRRVAAELENRYFGRNTQEAQAVRDAADVLTASYERMRVSQQRLRTPGWATLPETSEGYMPHRMSPGKIREMTPDQGRVLHTVLKQQFEALEGFDPAFSAKLASKYIDIIRKRGTAGYSAPIGVHNAEAADIVEQSAAAMGMTKAEANALAKRVLKAQPAHTRHRLRLDLTQEYEADGQPFQLLDLFETDQLSLLRSQAGRVSGEAALVRHGIMGNTGLKLLRRALDFGSAETKADNATLEAFDQVSAEFLGVPFGNAGGKWTDRALTFNSLASLGGMGFNQLAETLNGAVTLGVRHAFASVGSLRRLRAEVLALAKGQTVNNPIIGSLETYGAEFGTDHYKLVFPFDNQNRGAEVYGAETLSAADRLLRSGSHLQGSLSLWRAITSAQERGMAEQIVHKALRYINDVQINGNTVVSRMGGEKALADMGIDMSVIRAI